MHWLMDFFRRLFHKPKPTDLCVSWKPYSKQDHPQANHSVRPVTITMEEIMGGGTPTWPGTFHYDSGDGPGIHFDLNYTPSSPITNPATVHNLQSISVVCDIGSPYTRIVIRKPVGEWQSPVIPPGSGSFTKAQINAQGFNVWEDCISFTAMP